MPDSSVRKFGEWIVSEDWDCVNSELSAAEQSVVFEQLLSDKLNYFCPEKELKLGSQDKPFITTDRRKLPDRKIENIANEGSLKSTKVWKVYFRVSTRLSQKSI